MPEPPAFPWVTMVSALLVVGVFAGLVIFLLQYADALKPGTNSSPGDQQLRELRLQERQLLETSGYDEQSKSCRIPIDQAMSVLIEEGNKQGNLKSFPAPASKKSGSEGSP